MCDDAYVIAVSELNQEIRDIRNRRRELQFQSFSRGGLQIDQTVPIYFHVFIYTVADACWLPAQRLYLH